MPPGFWEWWREYHRAHVGEISPADDDGPPSPGGGVGDGGTPSPPFTNDVVIGTNLWLLIEATTNQTVVVTLSNTIAGSNYLLLAATSLSGPWTTNQSLLAPHGTNVTVAAPIGIYEATNLFFIGQQALPVPGSLRWVTQLVNPTNGGGDGFGAGLDTSPAISPWGPIYITSANSNLFAVDPIFGDVLWSMPTANHSTASSSITGSAAIAPDGTIYVGEFDGNLYSITPYGATNWMQPAGEDCGVYSTPAIGSNGLIYVTSSEGPGSMIRTGVTAFNPSDGSTNWFFQPQSLIIPDDGGDVQGSTAVGADGTVYFLSEGSRLYALSAEGILKWFLPVQAGNWTTPAIAPGGSILVGSESTGYFYCVNPDGSLKWIVYFPDFASSANITCEPAIGPDGTIYCGSDTGNLVSINPDGRTNWLFITEEDYGTFSTPALAADGTLYFGDTSGAFYAITTNGDQVWSNNIGGAAIYSSPAILPDGSVVVAGEDGNLYCFWGTAPLATNAPWPMFQHDPAHGGQAPPSALSTVCGAPFLFNCGNDGMGNFVFSMTGVPGTSNWNVYASTNLAETNWTLLATNLVLDTNVGNASFIDTDVGTLSQRFYIVSRSNCCSRAIGFVNLTVAPGTNLIADQLCQVDDAALAYVGLPMNTLYDLFALSNAWSLAQTNTEVYKWNGTGFDSDTNVGFTSPEFGAGGQITLLPGIGVLMNNVTGTRFTNWFNGLIREKQVFNIQPGTNYLSSTIPAAGAITNITSYVPHNEDTIQLWNTSSHAFVSYPYISNVWTDGTPVVGVGEGFVLITTNSYTWTNSWQQCPSP